MGKIDAVRKQGRADDAGVIAQGAAEDAGVFFGVRRTVFPLRDLLS